MVPAALLQQMAAEILLVAALTNYLLFLAFGLELPFVAAVFLLVLTQAGSVPPSLPGKIGIFNYLTVVGLGSYGIDRGTALGYSILLYAVALLPKVILGAAFVAARGSTGLLREPR